METLPPVELKEGFIFKGEVTQDIIDKSLNIFSFMCVGYYTLRDALRELRHDTRPYDIGWIYVNGVAHTDNLSYIFSTVGEVNMTEIVEPQVVTFIVTKICTADEFKSNMLS